MIVGVGEVLYVGIGVEAGVPTAVGVGVMAAVELLPRFPYPEPKQEKCEPVKSRIDRNYRVNLDKKTFQRMMMLVIFVTIILIMLTRKMVRAI